jgi:hypothetical protein
MMTFMTEENLMVQIIETVRTNFGDNYIHKLEPDSFTYTRILNF